MSEQEFLIDSLSKQLDEANRTIGWLHRRIVGLPSETDGDKPAPPSTEVDKVIDQLDRRIVGGRDRVRLRGALDKADAPLGGKAGSDEALGRAIGR